MKRLSKLSINPEKIIKNEELVNLRGGGEYRCCCGMGSNADCFDVTADSMEDAMYALTYTCDFGGGCFM